MKKRLNLLCACVLIGLLLSTSTVISLMVQAVSTGFKAGYESVEKGKDLNISDYKIVCTIPSDLFAETGSVTNLKNSSQASIKPIISLIEAPTTGSSLSRTANEITTLVSVIAGIFCLIQFFYLIRNINRGDIFSWKNVKFLRKLGVSLILLSGTMKRHKFWNSRDVNTLIYLRFPNQPSYWDSSHCWLLKYSLLD